MKKILIATTNSHKLDEIIKIFEGKFMLKSLKEFPDIDEPDEPYETFMENAVHKAKHYAKLTGLSVISEDAGFCVESLDLFPGVYSKRFIDQSGSLENAFSILDQKLQNFENKNAFFNCSAVFYDPSSKDCLIQSEGIVNGKVRFPPAGDYGMAYDHIFVPNGFDKTFSELGMEIKNSMSHRSKAMKKLAEKIEAKLN